MKWITIALIGAALSTPAFARWETVWSKTLSADSPMSVAHLLGEVNGAYDYLVAREQYRRFAGLPADTLIKASRTVTMDKWVSDSSTCTVDDPRQYEAIESGGVTLIEDGSFIFGQSHSIRDESWNPCEEELGAEERRMPEPKPVSFTPLKSK